MQALDHEGYFFILHNVYYSGNTNESQLSLFIIGLFMYYLTLGLHYL